MKLPIYTIISYIAGEQGWHDRCGDYQKGRDSFMTIQYFTDIRLAGQTMGEAKFSDPDTEFTILVNGLNEDQYYGFLSDEDKNYIEDSSEQIREVCDEKISELQSIKLQKDIEEKLRKEQAKLIMAQKEKDRIEQAERMQLAQLQAKYLNN